ncbi:hypothetical protein NQZ68_015906 [Dissostichus eleginoides]|nr:hypothetical protein NQZ68_015906 [Dissostichus eleginoides]
MEPLVLGSFVSFASEGNKSGHSQHQSFHRWQPASFTAPGHSPRRIRHASRTNLRSETELEMELETQEVDSHPTSTFPGRASRIQTIQVLGRCSSQAYHAYIRNNLNDVRHAHAQVSSI